MTEKLINPAVKCTPMQQAFAEALVGEARYNALKAARMAGYKDPKQSAFQQIQSPTVISYINKLVGPRVKTAISNTTRLIDEIEAIAYGNITDILDMDEAGNLILKGKLSDLPKAVQTAIKSVSVKEVRTKLGKREKVNRHFKLELHNKTEMIKLLTLINKLIEHPGDGGAGGGFTGLTLIGPSK